MPFCKALPVVKLVLQRVLKDSHRILLVAPFWSGRRLCPGDAFPILHHIMSSLLSFWPEWSKLIHYQFKVNKDWSYIYLSWAIGDIVAPYTGTQTVLIHWEYSLLKSYGNRILDIQNFRQSRKRLL